MSDNTEPNAPVVAEIRRAIENANGPIPFADFMRIALYHPESGYYRQSRPRVGFGGQTDFFTSTSVGEVFRELVIDACATLLHPNSLADYHFLEIGAEPSGGILTANHPFASASTCPVGRVPQIPAQTILFSNELFDAQPFHRLVFHQNRWHETGVAYENNFTETLLPDLSPPVQKHRELLPESAPEGYRIDLPLAAADLAAQLASPDWNGLFLAFDYGKSWRDLTEETPQGTARAYFRHQQLNDLLARPGNQDLTCHICWDWLIDALQKNGFRQIELQSQEAFFVTKATRAIEKIITARPAQFDPRRQSVQQLIYPGHMGQKFQTLTAHR